MNLTNVAQSIFTPFGQDSVFELEILDTSYYTTVNDVLGLNQSLSLIFNENIYVIIEVAQIQIVSTSGRLNIITLAEVLDIIINNYSNRTVDWVITLNGEVQAIIHINDTFYEF